MGKNSNDLTYLNNIHDSLFANNHQPIILIEPETGQIIETNLAAELFYGLTKTELKDRTIYDISANNSDLLKNRIKQAVNGNIKTWRSFQYNFSPEVYDVQIDANILSHQNKKLLFLTISDFKKANRLLTDTEVLFKKHYNSFLKEDLYILAFDDTGKLLYKDENFTFLDILDNIEDFLFLLSNEERKNYEIKKKKLENFETIVQINKQIFTCQIKFHNSNYGKRIYIFLIDITQKLSIIEDLREKQIFIERVTEQSPNIIYVFDIFLNKNIYINRDLRKYLGYDEDELPADSLEIVNKLIHPDDLKQFLEYEIKTDNWTKEYVQKFQMRLKDKSGKWRWFAGYEKEFLRKEGKITSIVGVLADITDIKETQQKLLEHEKKLKEAQKIAHLGYWEYDFRKDELYWSDETYRIFGLEPQKGPLSLDFFRSFVPADDIKMLNEAFKKSLKFDEEFKVDHKIILTDGTEKYVQELGKIYKNKEGQHYLIKGTMLDITERVLLEKKLKSQNKEYLSLYEEYKSQNEELRKAKIKAEESNRLKTEFLHNLSHEIRTPMNGIVGFAQMLDNPDLSKDNISFYSKMIINSSKQLLSIIDDILEISKLETKQIKVHYKETQISKFLNDIYSIYLLKAKETGLQFYLYNEVAENEDVILIDSIKLHKILSNLLDNAFKYTTKGYIELKASLDKNNLLISVKDTGIGIAPENIDKIFERFRRSVDNLTSKSDGLGLGLAIVKENVELMNGTIKVFSELGKGTEFQIILPYKKSDNYLEEEKATKEEHKKNPIVLVAEDEHINFVYLDLLLKKYKNKLNIIHAKDGKEAVDMAKKINPDIIFMDIKMPVKNGFEATMEIREAGINCPIIALTAYTSEDDVIAAQNAGCNAFISKPFNKEDIYNILDDLIKI